MNPPNIVRFFVAKNYIEATQFIDRSVHNIPDWEIVSVSHVIDNNNMVSVACVLKFKGVMKKVNDKVNLPEQTTEGIN
jgi:hypothetical protein